MQMQYKNLTIRDAVAADAARFYERHGFTPVNAMEGNDRYYIRYPQGE